MTHSTTQTIHPETGLRRISSISHSLFHCSISHLNLHPALNRRELLCPVWRWRASCKNGYHINQDDVNPEVPAEQTSPTGSGASETSSTPIISPQPLDDRASQEMEIFTNTSSLREQELHLHQACVTSTLSSTSLEKNPAMLPVIFQERKQTGRGWRADKTQERALQNISQDATQQPILSQADNMSIDFERPLNGNLNSPLFSPL